MGKGVKWEYEVAAVFRPPEPRNSWLGAADIQDALDRFGREGWELVTTHAALPGEPNEGIFLIFKRPTAD